MTFREWLEFATVVIAALHRAPALIDDIIAIWRKLAEAGDPPPAIRKLVDDVEAHCRDCSVRCASPSKGDLL